MVARRSACFRSGGVNKPVCSGHGTGAPMAFLTDRRSDSREQGSSTLLLSDKWRARIRNRVTIMMHDKPTVKPGNGPWPDTL